MMLFKTRVPVIFRRVLSMAKQWPEPDVRTFVAALKQSGASVVVGDFPEEPLYNVVIQGRIVASINDWPKGIALPRELNTDSEPAPEEQAPSQAMIRHP